MQLPYCTPETPIVCSIWDIFCYKHRHQMANLAQRHEMKISWGRVLACAVGGFAFLLTMNIIEYDIDIYSSMKASVWPSISHFLRNACFEILSEMPAFTRQGCCMVLHSATGSCATCGISQLDEAQLPPFPNQLLCLRGARIDIHAHWRQWWEFPADRTHLVRKFLAIGPTLGNNTPVWACEHVWSNPETGVYRTGQTVYQGTWGSAARRIWCSFWKATAVSGVQGLPTDATEWSLATLPCGFDSAYECPNSWPYQQIKKRF